MRRKEKEISDESGIDAIIEKAKVCKLGMVNGNRPYIVPLCFGYQDNTLYFHSALKGQKIDYIRDNSAVCFVFDLIADVKESEEPCSWGMKYQSVIGFGKAVFIEGSDEKRKALNIIMAQYSDQQFQFVAEQVDRPQIEIAANRKIHAKDSEKDCQHLHEPASVPIISYSIGALNIPAHQVPWFLRIPRRSSFC